MRKTVLVAALGALLSACGGSGGSGFKDPGSVSFTYGAPTAVVDGSDEAAAAGSALDGLVGASALREQGGADDSLAQDVVAMPLSLAGPVFNTGMVGLRSLEASALRTGPSRATALLQGDLVGATSGWDDEDCWVLTAAEVRFDHCKVTSVSDATTAVLSIDGTLHRSAGRVYWDLTLAISASGTSEQGAVHLGETVHATGDVAFDGSTVSGFERDDLSFDATTPSQSLSFKVAFGVELDLGYLGSPDFCITGGDLVAKAVWTERPYGASADDLPDQSIKFTWADNGGACSEALTVAWGVPD
jgi:hypothetical protein